MNLTKYLMKYVLLTIATVAVLLPGVASAQGKIGTVDVNRVISGCDECKAADSRLAAKQATMQKELDRDKAKLEKDYAEFEKMKPILRADAAQRREAELKKRFEDLQQKFAKSSRELENAKDEVGTRVRKRMVDAVQLVGKASDVDMIIRSDAAIYVRAGIKAGVTVDVTAKVIQQLNATKTKD